jgi:UDPglucose--hexose-1-phosphate uridylyltransferase
MPTVVVGGRQPRPLQGEDCPFCPGGVEAPEPYVTRWFPNRWPPLPDDRAEILLYAPEHGKALWQLGFEGVRAVIDLWVERTQALGARGDAAYVLIFENRGMEVGASVDHPHGQVYAFAKVPPVPLRELTAHSCNLCVPHHERFDVSRAGGWAAWCPEAGGHPYELRIAPDAHVQSLPQLSEEDRDDLARVLIDALARLDQLFSTPMPWMLFWHQRPTDDGEWPLAHVHAHVLPHLRAAGVPRYVGAVEVASGILFNPVPPEDAAARLRTLAGA